MKYHVTSVRKAIIKKIVSAGEDEEKEKAGTPLKECELMLSLSEVIYKFLKKLKV